MPVQQAPRRCPVAWQTNRRMANKSSSAASDLSLAPSARASSGRCSRSPRAGRQLGAWRRHSEPPAAGVADRLVVSERTVERHVCNFLTKLNIRDTCNAHRLVLAVLADLHAMQTQ